MIRTIIKDPQNHAHQPKVVVVVSLVMFVLMALNVMLSAQASHLGLVLLLDEQKAVALKLSNQKIRQELVQSTALTDLENQALMLGYTKQVNYVNVPSSSIVAFNAKP